MPIPTNMEEISIFSVKYVRPFRPILENIAYAVKFPLRMFASCSIGYSSST